jgi:hypothetical protein
MDDNFFPFSVLDQDENILLLERVISNGRTLICWINTDDDIISISLFNLFQRPNRLSRKSTKKIWGYPTHFVSNIETCQEAAEVVTLYVKDFEKENYWWEQDLAVH